MIKKELIKQYFFLYYNNQYQLIDIDKENDIAICFCNKCSKEFKVPISLIKSDAGYTLCDCRIPPLSTEMKLAMVISQYFTLSELEKTSSEEIRKRIKNLGRCYLPPSIFKRSVFNLNQLSKYIYHHPNRVPEIINLAKKRKTNILISKFITDKDDMVIHSKTEEVKDVNDIESNLINIIKYRVYLLFDNLYSFESYSFENEHVKLKCNRCNSITVIRLDNLNLLYDLLRKNYNLKTLILFLEKDISLCYCRNNLDLEDKLVILLSYIYESNRNEFIKLTKRELLELDELKSVKFLHKFLKYVNGKDFRTIKRRALRRIDYFNE